MLEAMLMSQENRYMNRKRSACHYPRINILTPKMFTSREWIRRRGEGHPDRAQQALRKGQIMGSLQSVH